MYNFYCLNIFFSSINPDLAIKEKILSHANSIDLAKEKNNFPANETFLCNWCYLWSDCKAKKIYNKINPSINAN